MFGIDVSAFAARLSELAGYAKLSVANLFTAEQSFQAGIVFPKGAGTGAKVDTADPTFGWADILGSIHVKNTGPTAPSFAVYQGNIYQHSFGTGAGVTEVFIEYHMPHDLIPSSDMYLHSHWSTASAPTGNVNWLFEVTHAPGYGRGVFDVVGGALGTTAIQSITSAASTAFQHEISEVLIATPGGLISPAAVNVSITSGTPTLTAASALFTAGDIDRTVRVIGAGAAGGFLDTTITAFTSTTQVTLAANASTTVTAQDAFRYRIIDSDLVEIDGIILARCYRNAARAADTLNVAPFLHFVDMHYQSNGVVGTKDKNYPFYS